MQLDQTPMGICQGHQNGWGWMELHFCARFWWGKCHLPFQWCACHLKLFFQARDRVAILLHLCQRASIQARPHQTCIAFHCSICPVHVRMVSGQSWPQTCCESSQRASKPNHKWDAWMKTKSYHLQPDLQSAVTTCQLSVWELGLSLLPLHWPDGHQLALTHREPWYSGSYKLVSQHLSKHALWVHGLSWLPVQCVAFESQIWPPLLWDTASTCHPSEEWEWQPSSL